jgi:hypothetical protein
LWQTPPQQDAVPSGLKHNDMYELIFWKWEVYLNHQEVYEALDDETAIEGLEELPVQVF